MQRRQPEAAVLLGVLGAADAEQAQVEQPDGTGEHPPPVGLIAAEVARDATPQARLGLGERQHPVELRTVTTLVPQRVVEVLLAAGGVRPGRLQMAEFVEADPDVGPRRRDRQAAEPLEQLLVVDPATVRVDVRESAATTHPRDPGTRSSPIV